LILHNEMNFQWNKKVHTAIKELEEEIEDAMKD
jgi:hypothetical protein